ncbi:hypothetical protein OAN94_05965 [Verrucomicrobiales bacterium]|nr:hypothetical protein [Verrucomicrobiales bacterium]
MAIMTVDAYTHGLVNEPEEKYYESGQPFRVEEIFDLGNELIEGATLIGNAVGNFESESILQGVGAVVIVRGIFAPRSLKLSTHSGPKTQLAPVSRTLPKNCDETGYPNRHCLGFPFLQGPQGGVDGRF